jgi:DNA-binding MarR family transcriptional regulator
MESTRSERHREDDDADIVNRIFAALGVAKDAYALLPPLPEKIRPVHISILNAIHRSSDDGRARVSDINKAMGFALPNTTRLINELAALKVVKKSTTAADKRVVLVRLTRLGELYTREYVLSFHKQLEAAFSQLRASDCATMIETIHKVHLAMQEVCQGQRAAKETPA